MCEKSFFGGEVVSAQFTTGPRNVGISLAPYSGSYPLINGFLQLWLTDTVWLKLSFLFLTVLTINKYKWLSLE